MQSSQSQFWKYHLVSGDKITIDLKEGDVLNDIVISEIEYINDDHGRVKSVKIVDEQDGHHEVKLSAILKPAK